MKLVDVPISPAYLVFHDAFMNGAMDVYPSESLELAEKTASFNNERMEALGHDEAGIWRAYIKLPRKRVWKYHPAKEVSIS